MPKKSKKNKTGKKTKKSSKVRKAKHPRIKDINVNTKFIVLSIILILIVLFFLNSLVNLGVDKTAGKDSVEGSSSKNIISNNRVNEFFSLDESTKITMHLPAVDSEGKGVDTILTVESTPGTGRTLTDIDNLLFWADTQHSMRMARRVAENITGKKMEDYDIIYTVNANASVIGGPSAGAAITVGTIAALQGRKLNEKVMITGSVNHDGSIGPVSAVVEKARAAKSVGASLFLVPLLQSRDVVYETTEHCETFGQTEICTTETRPKKIDVSQEAGIEVREIETIRDAMQYFFN